MEWGRLIAAANAGDGMAIDHLIDARLKAELPPGEEQTFEECCFLYWIRDGSYSQDARKNASLHDQEESSLSRDKNATRIDFRFIEASHMSRLLGLGLEGSWDVSVTFHPHSPIKVRVHLVEEPEASKVDLYALSRSWQRSGYKVVREWKRARVASVRTHTSVQPFQKRGHLARGISYIIQCVRSQSAHSKGMTRSILSDLALKVSLSESDVEEPSDCTSIMRVSVSAVCSAGSDPAARASHRGQVDLYGGNFCSLADWSVRECAGLDMPDSVDAQHGATTIRCTRLQDLSGAADMQLDTVWLLTSKDMHTFRASVKHELEATRDTPGRKNNLMGRFSRLFREPASPVLSVSKSLSMYVTCDLSFCDFLGKLGMMRRVRDQALKPNQGIQRLTNVGASARF